MTDFKEVFEMATKIDPDRDAWKDQQNRQRTTARNRKLGVFALVATIGVLGAFLALRAGETPHEVDVVGLDGSVQQAIPGLPTDVFAPTLSPDGTTLAFVTMADGTPQIGVIGIDGVGLRIVTDQPFQANTPTWSPDSQRIAFIGLNESGNRDVYVIDADGSNQQRLTTNPGDDENPQWSPDGSTILYNDNPTSGEFSHENEIWAVSTGGGGATRLTDDNAYDAMPSWSPDGTEILFIRGGSFWRMNADGSNKRPLLDGKDVEGFSPTWSLDGTSVAYLEFEDFSANALIAGTRLFGSSVLSVKVLDLATGDVTDVGVRVASDWNRPQWVGPDALLVNQLTE
jgi:TolB protein